MESLRKSTEIEKSSGSSLSPYFTTGRRLCRLAVDPLTPACRPTPPLVGALSFSCRPAEVHLLRFQNVIAIRGFFPLIRITSSTRARSYKSKTDLVVTKPGYSTKRQAFGNRIGIELMLRIWIDCFEKIESENSRSSCLGSARLYRCPFLAKKISFCGH